MSCFRVLLRIEREADGKNLVDRGYAQGCLRSAFVQLVRDKDLVVSYSQSAYDALISVSRPRKISIRQNVNIRFLPSKEKAFPPIHLNRRIVKPEANKRSNI